MAKKRKLLDPLYLIRQLSERPLRLPNMGSAPPGPGDPAIFGFNSDRDAIVETVVGRMVKRHGERKTDLEFVLSDAAMTEIRRLESQKDEEAKESLGFWKRLSRRIAKMSDADKRGELRRIAERMSRDVAGNFDTRVYKFSTGVMPKLLTGVMRPSRLPIELIGSEDAASTIDRLVEVEGDIKRLQQLSRIATLVFVPTHSSNLDSIVLGHALERAGLPPAIYGAGKNLFTNPIISFFMHNLGAYRVDRRVRARLYKDVLKSYSGVMVERGYHSLFFPGGTRSRSGLIESKLKLGLAGAAVEAYSRNAAAGNTKPVLFVPTTINYGLVLEAETLIEDWLRREGKARFIIEDDEFSRLDRWVAFFRRAAFMSGACVIRFGKALDPFGNDVDELARSIGPQNQVVDTESYVTNDGVPTFDPARDAAYTRALGERLAKRYKRETVIMSTQLVAHCLFRELVHATPGLDLFSRIRLRGEVSMPRQDLVTAVAEARDRLLELQDKHIVRVHDSLRNDAPEDVVESAITSWSGYHDRTACAVEGENIRLEDPTLLLFYQNRLCPFADAISPDNRARAAREIRDIGGTA